MTEQIGKSVEAQNLAEHIALIREAIESLRREVSDGLQQRVTHAELNGFHELYRTKLQYVHERIDNLDRHAENARIKLQNDLKSTQQQLEDERSIRKKAVYTGITSVVVMVVGGALLYVLGLN